MFEEPDPEKHFPELPRIWVKIPPAVGSRYTTSIFTRDYTLKEWKDIFFNQVKENLQISPHTPLDKKIILKKTLKDLYTYFDLTCESLAYYYIIEYEKT